jgi:hypothetical protein
MCESKNCTEMVCAENNISKLVDNSPCQVNEDCLSQACAYNSYNASEASLVCCESRDSVWDYTYTNTSAGWPSSEFRYFCALSIPMGDICGRNEMCEKNLKCRYDEALDYDKCWATDLPNNARCGTHDDLCSSRTCRDGICVAVDQPIGSDCGIYDELCESNACVNSTCAVSKVQCDDFTVSVWLDFVMNLLKERP